MGYCTEKAAARLDDLMEEVIKTYKKDRNALDKSEVDATFKLSFDREMLYAITHMAEAISLVERKL